MLQKHPLPLLLALIIGLLHLPVVLAHPNYLLTWFNTDDAYYYFVTARNVAHGQGFTFDGIARTNGFHPLWMFVLVPIFALPGLYAPLRVLVVVLVALNVGTALLLFRLVRRHLSPGLAFVTALAFSLLPAIHNVTTRGGTEAGLNAFFIVLLLYCLSRTDAKKPRQVLRLSLVAALAFLARLDNVFLAYLVGGWLVWRETRDSRADLRSSFRVAGVYYAPLTLVLAAYMLWNLIGFGTPTPVSGQVKRWWGTLPNSVYGFPPKRLENYVGQFFTDDESIGPWAIATGPYYRAAEGVVQMIGVRPTRGARRAALAGLGGLTLAGLGVLGWRNRQWAWQAVQGLGLIPLLLGCLLQIGYYKIGGSVAQRDWYWVAEKLWVVLAGGICAEAAWRVVGSGIEKRAWGIGNRGANMVAVGAVVIVSALLVRPHLPRIGRILSPDIAAQPGFYLRRAAWLEANTEPGARIAMTGSGSSAYFTQGRTLINLDGLINSYEYFRHMQNGTAPEYLAAIGVDYVFGNTYILTKSDPYAGIFEGRLVEEAVFRDGEKNLILWRFVP